jgi:large subunit ribosomal protein L30
MADMLQIKLVRSPIGYPGRQRKILRALGLGKMNSSVIHTDQPSIRGMIKHVRHLVAVTPWCAPEAGERREGELSE